MSKLRARLAALLRGRRQVPPTDPAEHVAPAAVDVEQELLRAGRQGLVR